MVEKLRRLDRRIVFAGVFVLVGFMTLIFVNAATPTAYFEAENAALSGASTVSDATASGGQYLQFGSGGGGSLAFPRIPWEGGSSYWKATTGRAQFAKADAAGWDDPSFFPISVFLGKADTAHIASLKDAGINTFMGVEHNPAVEPLTNITNAGLFAMPNLDPENAANSWTSAQVGTNPGAVAWFITDECDMGYSGCPGDQYQALTMQQQLSSQVAAYNDGRFQHSNFGNGILRTFWSPDTMDEHVRLMDSASADKYTYTSPDVAGIIDGSHDAPDWPNGAPVPRAYSYGWQVDQMRRFQDPSDIHPIWAFVETAKPFLSEAGSRTILPEEIEGAVWSSLIHEARGIAYFQHNNGTTTCTATYSIVQCSAVHAKVKAINAKVKSLAPVLNTQSYYNATRTVSGFAYNYFTFNNGTDTMLKTYDGSAYIFAGIGMSQSTGNKTFALPAGINGISVEVVGEGRTLPVNGSRQFTDTFAAEYSHHVYKVAL